MFTAFSAARRVRDAGAGIRGRDRRCGALFWPAHFCCGTAQPALAGGCVPPVRWLLCQEPQPNEYQRSAEQ